ncbi:MAG: M1 family aminopeptidase, partial [Chloroflexi bacterium]|nr:M1 family aminopeptidase [Chloroflexota bacterium]
MPEFDAITWGLEACHGLGESLSAGGGSAAADRAPFVMTGDRPVWGRDRPYRVEHLHLEFSFDLKKRSLHGVATTTFRPRADGLREAVFDAVDLAIESVTDDAGRPLPYTSTDRALRVDLGRARPASRSITTVVTYTALPRRGLYFNQPEAAYPDRPEQIWTQGQAEDSAHYFPCFDFPGEKFTSEMLVTVPEAWTAISNGRLDSVTRDGRRRTRTFHWKQETPHPAYLITLCAAEFAEVTAASESGVPVQYYGPMGTGDDLVRAFGRTPAMIDFFESKIGVRYPWAKYATVAVHDFIFGGMENTSATTMTDTLLHDRRAHPDFEESADSITAHELAHQWFGDLLTCREWSHGWLNESFATYFDALFVEHHRGWDAFRYNVRQNGDLYLQEDGASYRRPLVQNVFSEPIDIFDRHLYERGSVVLDMLRTDLGDDAWWRAINHYVITHAEGDVLTHDFQRAIEQATGRNVDGFFQQWVWKGGHPEFKAAYSWDAKQKSATVSLDQTQTPDDTLTSIYSVPLEIGFMVNGTFEHRQVRVTDAHHSFVFPLAAEPAFVSIDPAGRVLKTLDFAPGVTALAAALKDCPEAIGRIDAAKALAKAGSPAAIEALRAALLNRSEIDFVRAEIAAALGSVKSEAARDALIAGVKERVARVRRASALVLGAFRDEHAAGALQALLAGDGDASYYVQANAATALGRTLQDGNIEVLTGLLGRPAHNDAISAGALTGLGATRDAAALPVLIEHTSWGVHQNARRAATLALGALYPFLEEPRRTVARERLEELLDDRWLRVQIAAAMALEAAGDPKAVPALGG